MIYNIPSGRRGDTWHGINSISVKISGQPVSFAEREVSMQFRDDIDSPVALTLSTSNSGIEILMPAATAVRVLPFEINIPSGKYYYDFQVKSPSGYIRTYMNGSWTITPDITF